jgi:hypothetical protein
MTAINTKTNRKAAVNSTSEKESALAGTDFNIRLIVRKQIV